MKKNVMIALVIIVLAIAVQWAFLLMDSHKRELTQNSDYEEELKDLEDNKLSLLEELCKLEKAYRNKNDKGTVTVFIDGLDKTAYKTVYQSLKKEKVTGMLLLSEDEFPGENGCISEKQFEKMVHDGWRYSYYYSGTTSLTKYLDNMSKKFEKIGYKLPDSMYYDEKSITNSDLEVAVAYGVNNIITSSSSVVSAVPTSADGDDLLMLGMVDWKDSSIKDYTDYTKTNCGDLAVVISTSDSDCTVKKISSFIEGLKKTFKICTLPKARSFREEMYSDLENNARDTYEDIQIIKKKIENIDKQISDINRELK